MSSEAPATLPVVQCPGCEEPMDPKGVVPVTKELDDVTYVCPNRVPRRKKDRLEVELNKQICKTRSSTLLREYQRKIRTNWISLYHEIYGDE
jgi:hypothetical protein